MLGQPMFRIAAFNSIFLVALRGEMICGGSGSTTWLSGRRVKSAKYFRTVACA